MEAKIREYYESKNWIFSASHLALLFMIPMDVLKHLANTGKVPGVYPGEGVSYELECRSLCGTPIQARTFSQQQAGQIQGRVRVNIAR